MYSTGHVGTNRRADRRGAVFHVQPVRRWFVQEAAGQLQDARKITSTIVENVLIYFIFCKVDAVLKHHKQF